MTHQALSLLAELTYRCNLQCPYCYNPLDLRAYADELAEDDWLRVIDQAAALGVLQIHFSGGEPTLRADLLVALVRRARQRELYSNLITQGTFLDDALLGKLVAAGLDHVQISVQGAHAPLADAIAGTAVHERKVAALARVLQTGLAVTLNCVLHRANIDEVADIIALAEQLGIRRLELANAQLYGWAFRNRAGLLPSREQVAAAAETVASAQARLRERMEIVYVLADYYERYPKPCMHGWGQRFMTVAPDGRVLPCPAAAAIAQLSFENVRDRSLADIWEHSRSFNAYRGMSWMPEPCRSCDRRAIDFGGCRCQAFLLTGDARATDPACTLSPHHALIEHAIADPGAATGAERLVPRRA
ncbi:MAG: pyrroloquinoline quinone biosynthesis protein PqqE [Candidatus Eremiobacteraeota bacterium]|nr:pyrroloquinoline quinone biosynthesis protein PqqE [Candidatus Eremiobacteraeota bacterium]MBV8223050.1 pyrroloquinoline quinone biosynthesis protein PqqE [Candidatus Eremiobacteraeota bacterium]